VNGVTGGDVPRAAARLQDQHLPADPPVVGTCPDAAPRVFRDALIENDACELPANINDGKTVARGDAHALVCFRADLPDDAVGLSRGDDLRHAGIRSASRAYPRHVVDARNRIVGTNAGRIDCHRCREREY
jgi:hypothetical protein